jgi:uncharacterized protein YjbJ (UPF0337 family)
MVNEQVLQGSWNEIRGKLREKYGQLTDDDTRQFEGNVDRLIGLIQRKTGESREAIEHYLDKITSSASSFVGRAGEAAKDAASHAAESVRHAASQTSESIRSGYAQGEALVQQHPTSAVAVAFGAGMALGVVVGLLMGRSR